MSTLMLLITVLNNLIFFFTDEHTCRNCAKFNINLFCIMFCRFLGSPSGLTSSMKTILLFGEDYRAGDVLIRALTITDTHDAQVREMEKG